MTREEPVTTLRTRPLRIEPSLTRDYANQAQKMREIQERMDRDRARPGWEIVGWVSTVVLITYMALSIWGGLYP